MNIDSKKTSSFRPKILVTVGEPAGIGPDLLVELSYKKLPIDWVAIACPELLLERAKLLKRDIECIEYQPHQAVKPTSLGEINCWSLPLTGPVIAGVTDSKHAAFVIQSLRIAHQAVHEQWFDAMVTAPIQKAVLNKAGYQFTGHTEFLAELCQVSCPVMMLASSDFRMVLVTTHLPLRAVSDKISRDYLEQILRITDADLRAKFSIDAPRLLVCGLNPHAGEDGFLGTEEIDCIIPTIKKLSDDGLQITGPVSADTAFSRANQEQFDVFITMYHDQGLPVLKTLAFGQLVNITLGLPIIRTSVDHGTALPLAGTGQASAASLLAAVDMAAQLAQRKYVSSLG